MNVTVEQKCGRCGKSQTSQVTLEEANKIGEATAAREAGHQKMTTDMRSWLESVSDAPELVVARRTEGGTTYDILILDDLCSNPGTGKGKRGCRERVDTLIKELRMDNRGAKKPSKKTSEKASTTTTVSDYTGDEE